MRELLQEDWERAKGLWRRIGSPAVHGVDRAARVAGEFVAETVEAERGSKQHLLTTPVIIRRYRGSQASISQQYEADASRLLAGGYRVEAQEVIRVRRGCFGVVLGVATFGVFFLFTRPKDAMVVTYRRSG